MGDCLSRAVAALSMLLRAALGTELAVVVFLVTLTHGALDGIQGEPQEAGHRGPVTMECHLRPLCPGAVSPWV